MMRRLARWPVLGGAGIGVFAVIAAGIAPATALPAARSRAGAAAVAQNGRVSPVPVTGTPALVHTGSSSFQSIGQLVECNNGTTDLMYAVGNFTEIRQNGTIYKRDNIFSFSASPPYTVTSWDPSTNGPVESITLTSNCAHAYIGGKFSEVDGSAAAHIADIRTYNNTMVQDFAHNAGNVVDTVLLAGTHLLVGGTFKQINGSRNGYYVSLNPATGADDGYLNLHISGHYVYPRASPVPTGVYNQQLSPAVYGSYVLAEGVFTSVGGFARHQIFMMHLAANRGQVTTWYPTDFNQYCNRKEPFYVHDAAWSPDGTAIYTADTGLAPDTWPGTFPLTGLCDAAAAFNTNRGQVSPNWINYTGCDSLYSVAADGHAVYEAGHPRWSQNPNACNAEGPGAIPDRGLQGLWPSTGLLMTSAPNTARYTMARANATDMLVTSAGLWIASSNRYGADSCGGVGGLAGICLLPYPG
jgi:hypothetical protein